MPLTPIISEPPQKPRTDIRRPAPPVTGAPAAVNRRCLDHCRGVIRREGVRNQASGSSPFRQVNGGLGVHHADPVLVVESVAVGACGGPEFWRPSSLRKFPESFLRAEADSVSFSSHQASSGLALRISSATPTTTGTAVDAGVVGVAVRDLRGDQAQVLIPEVVRGGADPQLGAHVRLVASGVVVVHRANGGNAVAGC